MLTLSRAISLASASDVSGPVAMTVSSSSSICEISSRRIVISGSRVITSVTLAANSARSTASACPAGTAQPFAISISNDPARRISSFSSHGAVFSLSDFREFEQTSSAKSDVWCAGVERTGRISYRSTGTPRRAHCHAASEPANPAPIIRILLIKSLFTTETQRHGENQSCRKSLRTLFLPPPRLRVSVVKLGSRDAPHRFFVKAHGPALVQECRSQFFIEVDCGLVPVENFPSQAEAALFNCKLCN